MEDTKLIQSLATVCDKLGQVANLLGVKDTQAGFDKIDKNVSIMKSELEYLESLEGRVQYDALVEAEYNTRMTIAQILRSINTICYDFCTTRHDDNYVFEMLKPGNIKPMSDEERIVWFKWSDYRQDWMLNQTKLGIIETKIKQILGNSRHPYS